MNALLSELKIGALTLTPTFDKETFEYSATTTNATNTVTATPVDDEAEVTITVNDTEIESGDSVTWETGENTVEVVVKKNDYENTYIVTVTAS